MPKPLTILANVGNARANLLSYKIRTTGTYPSTNIYVRVRRLVENTNRFSGMLKYNHIFMRLKHYA